MKNNSKTAPLLALLKALMPIARLLMKCGVGYREFAEIAKCAFVDVATQDYGLRGRPTNISRVAVMTGLTRKEVKRLRDKIQAGDQIDVPRLAPYNAILNQWHMDPDFVDAQDRPKPLKFDGEGATFTSLVKKYGGDIPAGAMRTELKRVGSVAEDDSGRLTIQKRYFLPDEIDVQLQRALGCSIFGLATTTNHNIDRNDEGWAEIQAYSKRIRAADITRVRRIARDRSEEFAKSRNEVFSAYETIYGDELSANEAEGNVVGVGVYYFEADPDSGYFFIKG